MEGYVTCSTTQAVNMYYYFLKSPISLVWPSPPLALCSRGLNLPQRRGWTQGAASLGCLGRDGEDRGLALVRIVRAVGLPAVAVVLLPPAAHPPAVAGIAVLAIDPLTIAASLQAVRAQRRRGSGFDKGQHGRQGKK